MFAVLDGNTQLLLDRAHRLTSLPQGFCNSVQEFQRCITHTIRDEVPHHADAFVDDVGIKGPPTRYEDAPIIPGSDIRRFVYEFLTTANRVLCRFEIAGLTASGHKIVAATPQLHIVGTIASMEGLHLAHGVISKILKWVSCKNVTEVRGFLGIAGVARKWIKGFSTVVRPLTRLTLKTVEFAWTWEAQEAMDAVKKLVTTAPVLRPIDYELARRISPHDNRVTDHGLVIVAVDSSIHGTGWVLYQIHEIDKHPALFGSCTNNETHARYSQPKLELFGVFRALRDLRHRVWGLYFRLDVDAKFLKQMIHSPDLPNAPMTRWISYIQLFDFYLHHVPAASHQAADALSRRAPAPDDSDESDVDDYLSRTLAAQELVRDFRLYAYRIRMHAQIYDTRFLHPISLSLSTSISSLGVTPSGECGLTSLSDTAPPGHSVSYAALVSLAGSDADIFVGNDFMRRKVPREVAVMCVMGDEEREFPITEYRYAFITEPELRKEEGTVQSRVLHPDPPAEFYAGAGHKFGVPEEERDEQWDEIKHYLKDSVFPDWCESMDERKRFVARCSRFTISDERLWLVKRGKMPRLVVTDHVRRRTIIAEAHNQCGHRGRDATYTRLAERYYWPNLYAEVLKFVRSCNACQFRSKARPAMTYSPSWTVAMLRKFHLDTVYMPRGAGGKRYLFQASEPAIGWPEACASKHNTSKAWAKFIYTDIICRFSCIPVFVCDNGPEFKGAVRLLLAKYNLVCVLVSPYHPEANGVAERSHSTLVNSLLKACGTQTADWPLYLPGALLAMRTTTTRTTGYSPYYLLYGQNPVFGFDLADRTWSALDWYAIKDTSDLLAIRLKQITQRDSDFTGAFDRLNRSRKKAIEDYERRHGGKSAEMMAPGTLVLVHQTWLDNQHGNKGALRWAGPYVVHATRDRFYELRELDGAHMKGTIAADRVKPFFFRHEHQSMMDLPKQRDLLKPARADKTAPERSTNMIFSTVDQDQPERGLTMGDISRGTTRLCGDDDEKLTIRGTNIGELERAAESVRAWW